MKKQGIALVTTIMVLMVLTLLSVGLMFTIKNETAISIYQVNNVKTVQIAEAALDEIKYRMKLDKSNIASIGDTLNPLNPDWTTYVIFGTPPANTADIFYTKSIQCSITGYDENNPELDYTSTSFDANLSLKVRHKTDSTGTMIYYFDSKSQRQFLGSPALVEQYPPVEIVEITARSGNAVKKIIAEISKQEIEVEVYSALSSTTFVWKMTGNTDVYICGHNHKLSTDPPVCPFFPLTDGPNKDVDGQAAVSCWTENGATPPIPLYHVEAPFDATDHPTFNHWYYNIGLGTFQANRIEYDKFCSQVGCVAGIATTSAGIGSYGATKSHIFGNPDFIVRQNITIPPIWELLGFSTEAELDIEANKHGGWIWTTDEGVGLLNAANDDDIKFYKLPDGTKFPTKNTVIKSRGIIWAVGDLYLRSGGANQGLYHKGLIYVENDFSESAAGGNFDFWILGAMSVRGDISDMHTSGNKRIFFMYSKDALEESVSSASYFKILGWKENN